MAEFGPTEDFNQVREAIAAVYERIESLDVSAGSLTESRNELDRYLQERFITYGVRIARVVTEVTAAVSVTDLGSGTIKLTHDRDVTSVEDLESAVFNISEKIYPVGTLIAVVQVNDSFFVCSDPGVFVDVVLPTIALGVGADSFFNFVSGVDQSLIGQIQFADAEDTGDDATVTFTFSGSPLFTLTAGDSGLAVSTPGTSAVLTGTLTELFDFFAGSTTGTFSLEIADAGIALLAVDILTSDTRRATLDITTFTLDNELFAISGLTSAADKVPYFTGSGTAALADYTPVARTFDAATTVVAERSALGVSRGADVQIFAANGTWTKPSGAVTVSRYIIGGGGGGGSGRSGATATTRTGGGGGGGGGYSTDTQVAAYFGATETVTVGTGGAGGANNATADTNGNAGTAGNNSSMTGTGTGGATLTANGGGGGAAGSTAAAAGGTGGTGTTENGATGASSVTTGAASTGGSTTGFMAGAGGGAGGGVTSANGNCFSSAGGVSGGGGGARGIEEGIAGVAGAIVAFPGATSLGVAAFFAANVPQMFGGGGGGGGGGGAMTAGRFLGVGGTGGRFGGGGGGGAGILNGVSSFNEAGAGTVGLVMVVTLLD